MSFCRFVYFTKKTADMSSFSQNTKLVVCQVIKTNKISGRYTQAVKRDDQIQHNTVMANICNKIKQNINFDLLH